MSSFDEFFRAANGQRWVVDDRPLDAVQVLPDRRCVGDVGQGAQGECRTGGSDVAGCRVDLVAVTAQRVVEVFGVRAVGAGQPLENAQYPINVGLVGPVNALQVLLGEGAANAGILVDAVGVRGEEFVLEGGVNRADGRTRHEIPEEAACGAAHQITHC
ncbi:hypothetical protein ABZU75_19265 [Streptosporangium sp. NPDC005286]|uniref:hypothetical protein n=1 Tax=Streptosporangium sp. NPDC005286 TaxID=3154463 RepID=UPI00339FF7CA